MLGAADAPPLGEELQGVERRGEAGARDPAAGGGQNLLEGSPRAGQAGSLQHDQSHPQRGAAAVHHVHAARVADLGPLAGGVESAAQARRQMDGHDAVCPRRQPAVGLGELPRRRLGGGGEDLLLLQPAVERVVVDLDAVEKRFFAEANDGGDDRDALLRRQGEGQVARAVGDDADGHQQDSVKVGCRALRPSPPGPLSRPHTRTPGRGGGGDVPYHRHRSPLRCARRSHVWRCSWRARPPLSRGSGCADGRGD